MYNEEVTARARDCRQLSFQHTDSCDEPDNQQQPAISSKPSRKEGFTEPRGRYHHSSAHFTTVSHPKSQSHQYNITRSTQKPPSRITATPALDLHRPQRILPPLQLQHPQHKSQLVRHLHRNLPNRHHRRHRPPRFQPRQHLPRRHLHLRPRLFVPDRLRRQVSFETGEAAGARVDDVVFGRGG